MTLVPPSLFQNMWDCRKNVVLFHNYGVHQKTNILASTSFKWNKSWLHA